MKHNSCVRVLHGYHGNRRGVLISCAETRYEVKFTDTGSEWFCAEELELIDASELSRKGFYPLLVFGFVSIIGASIALCILEWIRGCS